MLTAEEIGNDQKSKTFIAQSHVDELAKNGIHIDRIQICGNWHSVSDGRVLKCPSIVLHKTDYIYDAECGVPAQRQLDIREHYHLEAAFSQFLTTEESNYLYSHYDACMHIWFDDKNEFSKYLDDRKELGKKLEKLMKTPVEIN